MYSAQSTITVISGGKKDIETDRHTQRQTDRHRDRQTYTEADRQTQRQTDRDRQRQTTDCQMLSAARAGVVAVF